MITIELLAHYLARDEVEECAVVSDRLPCAKIASGYTPIDGDPVTTDDVFRLLIAAGGSRYVEALADKPQKWRTRVDSVGYVQIFAVLRGSVVQARFLRAQPEMAQPELLPPPRPPRARPLPVADDGDRPTLMSAREEFEEPPAEEPRGRVESSAELRAAQKVSDDFISVGKIPLASTPTRKLPIPKPAAAPANPEPPAPRVVDAAANAGSISQGFEFDVPTRPAIDLDRNAEVGREHRTSVPEVDLSFDEPDFDQPTRQRAFGHGTKAVRAAGDAVAQRGLTHGFQETDSPDVGSSPSPVGLESSLSAMTPVPVAHGAAVLEELLRQARSSGASDMHVIAERPILLRRLGELTPRGEALDARTVESVVHAMLPARARVPLERDGTADFAYQHPTFGRFRVNVVRQRTGLKACMRLIPDTVPTLESLGLPEALAAATEHHQGLIVLTGPTGHGKTTTLAALVDRINETTTHHILSVEDPVEHLHPRKSAMISQREVGTHTKSFARALKGALREDPDVIVIGELRDTETVQMALSASETGHLVIGTMSTPNASRSIDRLIDLFPPADQQQVRMTLAGGLRLIVSQRLLPRADRSGMVAAVEILPGSVPLWNLIRENKLFQIPSLQQRGRSFGVIRLDDALGELVRTKVVTLDDALLEAEHPEAFAQEFRGTLPEAGAPAAQPGVEASPDGGGLLGRAGAIFGRRKV